MIHSPWSKYVHDTLFRHSLQLHSKLSCFVPYRRPLKKAKGTGRDRTPSEGQALRWRSSSQDVTGCWLEDAQEGLGRPTKTALQLQGVVFQAPASPLAAAQRALACTGPRPERQGSKAHSFIYSGCCRGLGISCLGEEKKIKQVSVFLFPLVLPGEGTFFHLQLFTHLFRPLLHYTCACHVCTFFVFLCVCEKVHCVHWCWLAT